MPKKDGTLTKKDTATLRYMGDTIRDFSPGLASKWRDPNARRSTNVEFAQPVLTMQRDIDEKMIHHARGREWVLNSPAYSAARERLQHYADSLSPEQRKQLGMSYSRPKRKNAGLATEQRPFGSIE